MLLNTRSGILLRQCALAAMAWLALLASPGKVLAQTVSLDNVAPIALSTSTTLSAVSIDAVTGNVIVRSTAGNYASCAQAAGPVINNFFPTSSTVTPGATITLNWSSSNTTSCTPAQGSGTIWSSFGTLPASGSQSFNAPGSDGPITFQLNCSNGSTTVSSTTQVTVQTGGVGNCTPIYPNGQSSSWNNVFQPWPAYGVRRRLTVPGNGFLSYTFVATAVAGQFGTIATGDFPGDGDGWGLMSISRSAGCFTPSELAQGCLGGVQRLPTISWRNGAGTSFQCGLTAGQTYYVNFTYGGGTSGPGPHCPPGSGLCAADVQNQEQD